MLDNPTLRQRGAAIADRNRAETKRLVLIYSGVLALLTLGINGLYLLLDSQIGGTGGLDGLGLRSVFQTIQNVLSYGNMIFGPVWSAGFLYAMMSMVRGGVPGTRDLLEGFRRFGRVLGYLAFQFLIVVALMTAAIYAAALIFTFSPLGAEFAELLGPVLTDPNLIAADGTINMALIPTEAMEAASVPMLVLVLAIFLPLYAWLSYGFRMALYLVMNGSIGGVRAHFASRQLMRGHKWQLLKLDLGFWWYYALIGLTAVVGYLDLILGLLGVAVPIDATVLYFLTMGAYLALQMAVALWKKCPVDAAYILAFESIAYPEPVQALAKTE